MRSFSVVLNAPSFDDAAGVRQADKPVFIQAFVAELSVETFDLRVLIRLARADERQLDASPISPLVEHLAVEFRTIINGD